MNSVEDVLENWFSEFRGVFVDVEFAGMIFGGKSGEASLEPREYTFDGETLEMRFGASEVLIATHASAIEIGYSGNVRGREPLIIPDALEVQFGWQSYGRPALPSNWCAETYHFGPDSVALKVTGPVQSLIQNQTSPRRGAPAIRLVPLSDRDSLLRIARNALSSSYPDLRQRAAEHIQILEGKTRAG